MTESHLPVSEQSGGLQSAGRAETAHRILLGIESPGNRREIARLLGERYALVEPGQDGLVNASFDLAIVDGPGLRHRREALEEARSVARPVFLPVMLILPHSDLRGRLGDVVSVIDDFITTPIDRTEFLERIQLLLRARKQALTQRDDLVRLVNYDRTTGLPNRHLFTDRVATAMRHADAQALTLVVVVIDIPMAQLRQSLGEHGVAEAARRCTYHLNGAFDADGDLAHLADQQWGAYLVSDDPMADVLRIRQGIGALADAPILAGGESFRVAPRLGAALYPTDMASAADLIDAATDASDRAEPGAPAFHSPHNRDAALHYLRTEARLHDALAQEEFEIWLQPKIPLQGDGTPLAAEALIRWRRPSGELVPPGDFIPIAEASGLIRPITFWVLKTAARTIAAWQAQDQQRCQIAVNVTPADIQHDGFLGYLQALCAEHGIAPESLALELTETMFCDMGPSTMEQLRALLDSGFAIAIDDFGTGYSSLALLQEMPASTLKIDKCFIDDLPDSARGASVVQAIVKLADAFNLNVVAEGIENEAQCHYLQGIGVNVGQGYFIARPMPVPDFETWQRRQP